MSRLFHRKTPQELLREQQRLVNKSIREIDRERVALQQNEKKTILEIKKLAKEGQVPAAKILAKNLVKIRANITKMYSMRAQLQTVSMQLSTMKSTAAMNSAMAGATKAMLRMNKKMNLPAMQKITMEFQRQNEKMGMTQEMMDDVIEDAMGDDEDVDEESEEVINQTLEEIGIDLEGSLASVPKSKEKVGTKTSAQKARPQMVAEGGGAVPSKRAPAEDDEEEEEPEQDELDLELEARFNALKK